MTQPVKIDRIPLVRTEHEPIRAHPIFGNCPDHLGEIDCRGTFPHHDVHAEPQFGNRLLGTEALVVRRGAQ